MIHPCTYRAAHIIIMNFRTSRSLMITLYYCCSSSIKSIALISSSVIIIELNVCPRRPHVSGCVVPAMFRIFARIMTLKHNSPHSAALLYDELAHIYTSSTLMTSHSLQFYKHLLSFRGMLTTGYCRIFFLLIQYARISDNKL